MTYGEYKKTDEYLNAQDITVCINGEDEIDEMYYPDELDFLPVVGVGYDATLIKIDLVCSNWDKRFDIGWIGELIMYRILYKGFNGGFSMSDEMGLETAKEYKQKYLNMGYTQVFIIQIVE